MKVDANVNSSQQNNTISHHSSRAVRQNSPFLKASHEQGCRTSSRQASIVCTGWLELEAKLKGDWSKTGLPENRIFEKASARRSPRTCERRKKCRCRCKNTQSSRRREVKSSLVRVPTGLVSMSPEFASVTAP